LPNQSIPFKNGNFQLTFARSTSTITPSEKSSIITESTMHSKKDQGFPMHSKIRDFCR